MPRAVLCGIGTASPSEEIDQPAGLALAVQANQAEDQKRLRELYRESQIDHRKVVLGADGLSRLIFEPLAQGGRTTPERLLHYSSHAIDMATRSARLALHQSGMTPSNVTHLVTVSCTGAETPGPWLGIQQTLGLASDLSRSHIGFMGCNAAINGLAVANAFARQDPAHVVLVVCVEVCSIHYAVGNCSWDQQVANALFADGSAAAVVAGQGDGPQLVAFGSHLFPDTSDLMSWTIGDHGFEMHLSPRVPIALKRSISSWVKPWLDRQHLSLEDIESWAVHPGGRDILEGVRRGLGLPVQALAPSLDILQRYGNMSSGTVLWILQELLSSNRPGPSLALAFGPGLVGEALLLQR